MKKTSLLSLLTAAAIVATSAGTYAVWDTMSATASGQISVAKPKIKLTTGTLASYTATEEANAVTYTGDATFAVKAEDIPNIEAIAPEIKVYSDAGHTTEVTNGIEAKITNASTELVENMVYNTSVKVTDENLAGDTLYVVVTATATPKIK